ncbi:GNAT family N-acetyltransferase [Solwaraspora sp. WMMB335]|uniref:GNAT family N-acetyltransferase n=1 Tax=Solwaraspora sp. WMMB335 TaxID=3404118 RepID=UPI003B939DBD
MANQENGLLARLDRFCDAVPRAAAHFEELGDYVLFVRDGAAGWPFYARPRVGVTARPAAADITTVRARQRELGLPESFEWIHERNPDLLAVARSAGLGVQQAPLMVLDPAALAPTDRFADLSVRLLDPDSPTFAAELATWYAVTQAAFGSHADGPTALPSVASESPEIVTVTFPTVDDGHSGTVQADANGAGAADSAVGSAADSADGLAAVADPAAAGVAGLVTAERLAIRSGARAIALARLPGDVRATAAGSLHRVGDVAEIAGVGTLPAARRRGLASAVTLTLAGHALADGVELIFLAANDDDVAVLYHRLGFRRVGTSCIAAPSTHP